MADVNNFIKNIIIDQWDVAIEDIQLNAKVLIFFLPSWSCLTSKHIKQLAVEDFNQLYNMSREELYPELYKLEGEELSHALYRHHMEVAALDNFISYYSNIPMDLEADFILLFEPFIRNTCEDGICLTGDITHFEDNGVKYMLPTLELIDNVVNDSNNPYTGRRYSDITKKRILDRYRVEIKMLY